MAGAVFGEHMSKYAIYNQETGELGIGRDVPGLASYGAAIPVGTFDGKEQALAYAKAKGCDTFNGQTVAHANERQIP